MKQATTRIHISRSLPTGHIEKRSDLSIVRETNEKIGINISVKAASDDERGADRDIDEENRSSQHNRYTSLEIYEECVHFVLEVRVGA